MTITRTGPGGYEQQYRVTAWLALELWEPSLDVRVEEVGGEDATLLLAGAHGSVSVELQVKGGSGDVDAAALAGWLAHFPDRADSGCLLQRLQQDPQRMALFVCAGRCTDAVKNLIVSTDQLCRPRGTAPLNHEAAQQVLDLLEASIRPDKSGLAARRRDTCRLLAQTLSPAAMSELLKQVNLVENFGIAEVQSRAEHLLRTQFAVPLSIAPGVFDPTLRVCVERSRDSRENLVLPMSAALERARADRLFPNDPYVKRGDESQWQDALRDRRVVLLTGPPLCGKSFAAKRLAQDAQDAGVHCRLVSEIPEARRFLLDRTSPEERLALIDDPLGKLALADRPAEELASLAELIGQMPAHRQLIVTSREDLLRQTLGADVRAWSVAGSRWFVLDAGTDDFQTQVWTALAADAGLEPTTSRKVLDAVLQLRRDDRLLPGQLHHLARQDAEALEGQGTAALARIARFDSRDLGRALCLDGKVRDVLVALKAMASSANGVRIADLAFVLSDSNDTPSRRESELEALTAGRNLDQLRSVFSQSYSDGLGLTDEAKQALDLLERRGLVVVHEGAYLFRHPAYEQASEEAFKTVEHFAVQRTLGILRRAVFCLSPIAAANAVRTVNWFRRQLSPDGTAPVLELAFSAFDSAFPKVADVALIELISDHGLLDEKLHERLVSAVQEYWGARHRIAWHDGQAYYAVRNTWFLGGGEIASPASQNDATELLDALRAGRSVSPEQLWKALEVAEAYRDSAAPLLLDAAMTQDEAAVRGKSAFLVMRYGCHHYPRALSALRAELHPVVVSEAVAGFANGESEYDSERRSVAIGALAELARQPLAAILVLNLLTNYEAVGGWYGKKSPPWHLWAELAPVVLDSIPPGSAVHEAHLYYYAERALKSLPMHIALRVLDSWIGWLEREVIVSTPGDYARGVFDLLFRVTRGTPEARGARLARLLSQKDTSVWVTAVAESIDAWDNLLQPERALVLAALHQGRRDARWARAVALTRERPPPEATQAVAGAKDLLDYGPEEVVARLDHQVLADCLGVYTGHPQPLWFVALHHHAKERWEPVIEHLGGRPEHPLFDFCTRTLLREGQGLSCWAQLCTHSDAGLLARMFDHLLRWTVIYNHASLKPHWSALLGAPCAATLHESWAKKVAENIEAIDGNNNLTLLQDPAFWPHLEKLLPTDCIFWTLAMLAPKLDLSQIEQVVEVTYATLPPRLASVHAMVGRLLKHSSREDLRTQVEALRLRALNAAADEERPWGVEKEADDWVVLCRESQD